MEVKIRSIKKGELKINDSDFDFIITESDEDL